MHKVRQTKHSFLRVAFLLPFVVVFAGLSTLGGDETEVFNRCWETRSAVDHSLAPTADGETIFFRDSNGKLTAIEADAPTRRWSTEIGGEIVSNLLVTETAVVLAASSGDRSKDLRLISLSKRTGVANWTTDIPATERAFVGVVDGSIVVVGSGGAVLEVEGDRGSVIWRQQIAGGVTAEPVFASKRIILAGGRNEIVIISAGGKVETSAKLGHEASAIVSDGNGRVLVGDHRGNLLHISTAGTEHWTFRQGARISYLFAYENDFVAASDDNFLYKISRGGDVEWKRRLPGRFSSRPVVIGKTVVVSIVGEPSIFVIDLETGKVSHRLAAGSEEAPARVIGSGADSFAALSSISISFYNGTCRPK